MITCSTEINDIYLRRLQQVFLCACICVKSSQCVVLRNTRSNRIHGIFSKVYRTHNRRSCVCVCLPLCVYVHSMVFVANDHREEEEPKKKFFLRYLSPTRFISMCVLCCSLFCLLDSCVISLRRYMFPFRFCSYHSMHIPFFMRSTILVSECALVLLANSNACFYIYDMCSE